MTSIPPVGDSLTRWQSKDELSQNRTEEVMNRKIFGMIAEKKYSDSGMLFTFTEQMLDY